MAVTLKPMPRSYLKISEKRCPGTPPIYDSLPTLADIAEAHALFAELDPESQAWYRRNGFNPVKSTQRATRSATA